MMYTSYDWFCGPRSQMLASKFYVCSQNSTNVSLYLWSSKNVWLHLQCSKRSTDAQGHKKSSGSHLRLHKQPLWAQHEFLRSDALLLNGFTPFLRSGFVHDHEPAVPVCHRAGEILTVQEEQDQPDHGGNEAGQGHGPPAPGITPTSLNNHHERQGHDGGNDEERGRKQPVPGRIARTLKLQLHQLLQSHQDEAEGHVRHQRTVAQLILQSRKPLLSTSHTNNTWKSEESWPNSSHTFAEGHWCETNWSRGKFSPSWPLRSHWLGAKVGVSFLSSGLRIIGSWRAAGVASDLNVSFIDLLE